MEKDNLKGFLIVEGMIALVITFLGITIMALVVGQSRALEQKMELKTDRVYAWHVMNKCKLPKMLVHNHVYKLTGSKEIYDTTNNQTYKIKK